MYVQIHDIVDAYIRWSIISFVHGAWKNCPRTIARMHRRPCTRQQHVHGLWLQPVYAYTFEYPHVCAARTQYTQPCMYICSGICVPAAVRTYTYLNTHVPMLALCALTMGSMKYLFSYSCTGCRAYVRVCVLLLRVCCCACVMRARVMLHACVLQCMYVCVCAAACLLLPMRVCAIALLMLCVCYCLTHIYHMRGKIVFSSIIWA